VNCCKEAIRRELMGEEMRSEELEMMSTEVILSQ